MTKIIAIKHVFAFYIDLKKRIMAGVGQIIIVTKYKREKFIDNFNVRKKTIKK